MRFCKCGLRDNYDIILYDTAVSIQVPTPRQHSYLGYIILSWLNLTDRTHIHTQIHCHIIYVYIKQFSVGI